MKQVGGFLVHRRKLSDLSGNHRRYIVNGKRFLFLLRQCVPHGLEHSGGHSFPRLFPVVNIFLNDLERGESASKTGRKHIPTRLFKQAVSLSKQARAIEAALDGINPLNAGKKKEEALSMLKKWFPQMENFSGQLKKYKVTINDLLAENEKLEASAKASEKGKMKDTMERAKLKSELDNLQRLVDRIPPEVLAELKRQRRHTVKER